MIGAKWFDPMIGVDIHIVLVPAPPSPTPIPTPLPHPFVGVVYDPMGLAIGSVIAGILGAFKGVTFINHSPAANTGTDGTNKMVLPHFPTPPGTVIVPPAMNEAKLFTGSKTVHIAGSNACRLGDRALSCAEPVRLPTTTVLSIPLGPPVLVGGPPAIDWLAVLFASIRTKWVSNKIQAVVNKIFRGKVAAILNKIICFFTGHPVDVASGMVMTDAIDLELPGPIPLIMERTYYSRSDYDGPLGVGWTHTYDQHIRFEKDRIVLHNGEGRAIYFDLVDRYGQTRNHAEQITLIRKDNETTLITKENLFYRFGECGSHNGRHYLFRIDDYNGSSVRLLYDEQGLLIKIIDSAGRTIKFVNNDRGRLVALAIPHPDDPSESQVIKRYGYDFAGDLVVVADALGNTLTYKYKYHLLVQETNRNGLSFYFAYDGIDKDANCVRTWGDGGIYDHLITYDKQNHITIVEDSLGNKTIYFSDDDNLITKVVDARGGTTTYTYDEQYRKTSETDPLGNMTCYNYDVWGNIVERTDPDGTVEKVNYNNHHLPVYAIDKVGGEWKWAYDDNLRITEKIDPLGRKMQFMYTGKYLSATIDAAGVITGFAIDSQGNLGMVKNPDGSTISWEYDPLGQCQATIDQHQNRRAFHYDKLGRLVRVDEPDGNRLQFEFDPEGNVLHAKDNQCDVRFGYCGMNKLVSRTQYGTEVRFVYDTEERLTEIHNEHGNVYRFILDACGDVLVDSGFDGIRRVYARNLAGWVERVERPDYRMTHYTYDPLGRVTGITYDNNVRETYAYREDGELIEAVNGSSIVKFERDPLGRIEHEWQNNYQISSEYDVQGNRIRLHSSLGADQLIRRNTMGDAESVKSPAGPDKTDSPWEARFLRDRFGLEMQREMPGGLSARWQRDRLGRPINHEINTTTGYHRMRTYDWDVNNRLKSIDDSLYGKTVFHHDPFGNLVKATMPDSSTIFRIPDAIGNLFRSEQRNDRTYGPAGQLLEATTSQGVVKYEYDGEGNLIRKALPDGTTWEYVWNGVGMLEKVVRPDKREVTFTYDAFGRRITKTFDGKITRWVWDGNVPLHQWIEHMASAGSDPLIHTKGDDGSIKDRFTQIHFTGREAHAPPLEQEGTEQQPITWVFEPESFTPLARKIGNQYHNIVTDHLGTPIAMFDEQGNKAWSQELDIFGHARIMEGKTSYCPFRYPGQYEDEETGLYYNRFRYFDPETGGYVSQDPLRLTGSYPNFYQFVQDPSMQVDIFGLAATTWNEFQQMMKGTFTKNNHLAGDNNLAKDAASGWKEYKKAFQGGDEMVIGGLADTAKFKGKPGFNVLDSSRWSLGVNDSWVRGGMDRGATFKPVSSTTDPANLWDSVKNRPKVYARELDMLKKGGYTEVKGKMKPPKKSPKGCGK